MVVKNIIINCVWKNNFPLKSTKKEISKYFYHLETSQEKSLRIVIFYFIKANIINLCFALVDDSGKWINFNRVGDPMIKGKT